MIFKCLPLSHRVKQTPPHTARPERGKGGKKKKGGERKGGIKEEAYAT